MIRKNKLLNIESKKNIAIFAFMVLIIAIMTIGFLYFQNFLVKSVKEKHIDRMRSYAEHNTDIIKGYKDISDERNLKTLLYYDDNESLFVISRTGDIIYNFNSPTKIKVDNIFDAVSDLVIDKKNGSLDDVKASLLVGVDSGTAVLKLNRVDSILYFNKITGESNNYIVTLYPYDNVLSEANNIILKFKLLVAIIIIAALIVGLFYYLTDKRFGKTLRDMVYKDELTGHISYTRFLLKAEEMLSERGEKKFAIYYGDIKNFKYINDTFGYDVGDKFLIYVSEVIKKSLGNAGAFARITADSFAIIREYENREDFIEKIYSTLDKISEFTNFKKENFKVGVYVGVYCSENPKNEVSLSEMLDRANMAQKSIKGSNEFHVAFYNEDIRQRIIAEKEIEKKMESALAKGEFVVFYQPKFEVKSGEIIGAEALVRWNSPERGLLLPGKFIPLFEQNGFIVNLDQYVFENVCKTVREWLDNGKKVVSISINVSRVQFYRLDFVKRYTKIKNKYEIPDGLLELEFTESIVLENIELLQKIVNNLKANGFLCSIDDFGSGYSSLNILKNLPMDILKLDRLFFIGGDDTERDKALIASVVTMARALKMKTVSEGIETWNQVNFLKEIGCDIVQGFVYSEPISKRRFEHMVEGKKKRIPEPDSKENSLLLTDTVCDNNELNKKYRAILNYLNGVVIESDYKNDTYKVVKLKNIGVATDNYTDTWGENKIEKFSEVIEKYIHPDDKSSVRERCLPIGVLAQFYQGEEMIITDFRFLSKNMVDYIWCRATILKVSTGEDTNFNSLTLIENIEDDFAIDRTGYGSTKLLLEAIYKASNIIYEINFSTDKYIISYYNKDVVGDRPESGEFSWFREQYIKKIVHPDDLIAFRNFISPQNILEKFEKGKDRLLTQARLYLNDEIGYLTTAITMVRIDNTNNDEVKAIVFCQSIDDLYKSAKDKEELTEFVNNAVCEYYDLVYLVDLKSDDTTVIQANHAFSKLPRSIKYSNLVKKMLAGMIYPKDADRVEKFFDPHRITTAIKLGRAGNSCDFKRVEYINGQEALHSVRATYMRIPSTNDTKILFLVRELGEIESHNSGRGADPDPLRKLYKKETTEILIDKVLDSIAPGETKAFILMDLSDVESLDDNNSWEHETKEGIIKEFEIRLSELLSDSELLCRSGGYEFIILSDKTENGDVLAEHLNNICNLLKEPMAIDGREYKITGNIGVSIYGVDGTNFEKLYINADMALNHAKCEELDSYKIYN